MSTTSAVTSQEFQALPFNWSWRNVLYASAVGEFLLLAMTIVALHDLLAAALAIILLIGLTLFLLHGKMFGFIFEMIARVIQWRVPEERIGALVLGFLFADIGFYTVTGTASNLWTGAGGSAILLPASLATFAVMGFVAAIVCVLRPRQSYLSNHVTVNFVAATLVVSSIILGIGLLRGVPGAVRALPPTDVKLITENMSFSKSALQANAGHITLQMENHDLFWHSFTIDSLGVNLQVPMQATQEIAFEAPAGIYTFHCSIPGHEMLGMTGTLTVR